MNKIQLLMISCLLALLGCGQSAREEKPPFPGIASFPHDSDWADPARHGLAALTNGIDTCTPCHPLDPPNAPALEMGGEGKLQSEALPACRSCHSFFPHVWGTESEHGGKYLSEGKADCATRCHGVDLLGGLSGVSCNKCHSSFPHSGDWIQPAVHGPQAEWEKKADCQSCHGTDYQGGKSGVGCNSCHKLYPHPEGWVDSSVHGGYDQTLCATACHGTDLLGGVSKVACDGCHKIFPHAADWKTDHQVYNNAAVCRGCHAADGRSTSNNSTCYACHPYPHRSTWADPNPSGTGHGLYVLDKTIATCTTSHCHDTGLTTPSGKATGPICKDCHQDYPHPSLWPPMTCAPIARCKPCHGDDLMGGTTGISACYQCHYQDMCP